MKNLVKFLALVLVIGFVSCTDNTEILEKNEKQELQSINKEDNRYKGSGEDEEIDNDED